MALGCLASPAALAGGLASAGLAAGFAAGFAAAGFAGGGLSSRGGGRAGFPLPAPPEDSARVASASSTVDAAALTSTPAAFRAAMRSLLETPFSLAIS